MKRNNLLGIILIVISIMLPIFKYSLQVHTNNTKDKKVISYLKATSITNPPDNITNNEKNDNKNDYLAILEIPQISLKRGLVAPSNKYNDIEYNIAILGGSQMPDIKNSNLILAAHNGNSPVSFFKNLEKLNSSEYVYIYYQGYKYIYQVANYYILPKTGTINITRDKTKNTLTLITCKNNSDTEQIVYMAYLVTKEAY